MTQNLIDKDQTCWVPRWQLIKATLNNLTWGEFKKSLSVEHQAVILDVRTSDEFNEGHLDNATNLDYLSYTLAEDLEELDKTKTYYVYCKTGRRSLRICVLLKNIGFRSIYNLDEGVGEHISELQMV